MARLRGRERELQDTLAGVSSEITNLLDRRALLERVAERREPVDEGDAGRIMRGRELRQAAGQLLWHVASGDQLHYRELYERLIAEEIQVGGQNPLASFLTNLRDSPAVTKGSRPGYYRIDPTSEQRVQTDLGEALAELADVTSQLEDSRHSGAVGWRLDELRLHRDRLGHRVKALEADLSEIRAVFTPAADMMRRDAA